MSWFDSIEHVQWLSAHMRQLMAYGARSEVPTGFGTMDAEGNVHADAPVQLYITARMTHIYSLGVLLGLPGCRRLAAHGITCLREYFWDREYGGWFDAIEPRLVDGKVRPAQGHDDKRSYSTAFVMLAAATATAANRNNAHELLRDVLRDHDEHWWDDEAGMVCESYTRDYSVCEAYRGMNSNMHTVEALLVAADVTHESIWLERAVRILRRVVEEARTYSWRVPEHFDAQWRYQPDYHADDPADPHRAYGHAVGHSFEFVRLLLEARAMWHEAGHDLEDWMLEGATEIFERARVDAWRRDGAEGFAFTVDAEGKTLIHDRLAWVCFEAINAAVTLYRTSANGERTMGDMEHYEHCYHAWIDYAARYLLGADGSVVAKLNRHNEAIDMVNAARRETIYHAVQALLLPRLPLTPSLSMALATNKLDKPEWTPVAEPVRPRGLFGKLRRH
ncbi:AGE family epimerase/isomerase [Nanchangia anserum]|uniref:AGE family epimerase/isomerase n=1 Tax=Nanchangia anserum TaxID=2692125 RepID=A0A8I0G7T6_9ACTO|nr:AGE family epimerase/isomerase [Nanchangia anserum]MBD3689460.1 AGE family epimerase/isomerase [Nanchangia anserum]QOX81659.1 AGE family epimerase/isomerase [Nanchangia anserum]